MQEQKCSTPIFPEQAVNDLSSSGLQVQKLNWNLKIKAIDSANFFVTKLNAKKRNTVELGLFVTSRGLEKSDELGELTN